MLPILCFLLAVPALAGCAARAEDKNELTVFAASSLTDAFEELGKEFEQQNPGVDVRFNFAGSSALLAQLQQGTPADVFASADTAKMEKAEEAEIVSEAEVFARNSPEIIVPADNPGGVKTMLDLAEAETSLVLAQEGVPIAEYTEEILSASDRRYGEDFRGQVLENAVSRESDVRAAANRVALGEVDATFVYASDVTPEIRDRVEIVEIPEDINVIATYPIAIVEDTPNPELAEEWSDLVLSEKGQRVVGEWGFKRVR